MRWAHKFTDSFPSAPSAHTMYELEVGAYGTPSGPAPPGCSVPAFTG